MFLDKLNARVSLADLLSLLKSYHLFSLEVRIRLSDYFPVLDIFTQLNCGLEDFMSGVSTLDKILLTTMTGPRIGSSRGQIEDQFASIVNPITQLVYGLLAFNSSQM
ncbi:MAG: hypothetical protein OHK93_006864 [Ramalina farinacea]|uniref:Uncharacterized protein n=1 Tax=Ramalina farinacea TaxID=258253 RepID=A0AA43QLM2_9LECA|nr:hypothetical protein [Ramalina farinacea]